MEEHTLSTVYTGMVGVAYSCLDQKVTGSFLYVLLLWEPFINAVGYI